MNVPGWGEVTERLRRSTVQVLTPGGSLGVGSGVICNPDGLIVTNAHVARAPQATIELWDGRRFPARVTRRDRQSDLASLETGATGLPAAVLGDSGRLRVGELVVAVGNPMGFAGAASTGMVHALGPVAGLDGRPWVQADVRLLPGNSGGPLADAQGRVVGINTMVINTRVAGGLALAVPSNRVTTFLERGVSGPSLGVVLRPVPLARGPSPALGLLVLEVAPGSPAAHSSLLMGDILTGIEGVPVRSVADVGRRLQEGPAVVRLQFLRGAEERVREAAVDVGVTQREAA